MLRYGTAVFTLFLIPILLIGNETTVLYPNLPSSIFFSPIQYSPAYVQDSTRLDIGGVYTAKISDPHLSMYHFFGSLRIQTKTRTHGVQLLFSNENEGPYISTPRGIIGYAQRVKLFSQAYLSLGIQLGFAGRNYSAPSATGKGSGNVPDGNVGMEIRFRRVRFGVSMMQFMNTEKVLLTSSIQLRNYYQAFVSYRLRLDSRFYLTTNGMYRVLPNQVIQLITSFGIECFETVELNVNYVQRRGVSFHGTLSVFENKYPLKIQMAYISSVLAQSPLWLNSIELGLIYSFSE